MNPEIEAYRRRVASSDAERRRARAMESYEEKFAAVERLRKAAAEFRAARTPKP